MTRGSSRCGKPVIGLTGGVGAGKSEVARAFASLGAGVVDSDRLSHEQLADPEVVGRLRSWWGDGVIGPDGTALRRAISSIVFGNQVELKRLERLLYPRIERRRRTLMAQFEADPSVRAIVLDSPKLYEAGLDACCDAVVFVDAPRSDRLRRVASRGWTEEDLLRRENFQKPLDTKKARADYVVVNHTGIAELRPQVERILKTMSAAFS